MYPFALIVSFDYGDADGINDRLSRIEVLVDDDDTVLAEYQHLGLGAVVQQDSPEADLRSTLVSLTGTNNPNTGDVYSGLDRFGRVTDVRWRDVSASSDLSRVQYGYDRASNRTWRKNPSDTNSHHDWAYGYDGLHRLKHADRGTLASPPTGVTDPQFAQCWSLDATGNWAGFRQANTGNPWSLVQARTANAVNEITGITNSTGSAWAQPAYDPAGNTTTIPQPADPTGAYTATYDAWNRLVKLTSGANTVQENVYDARGYRIVRKSYTGGVLTETRHYYYTNGWRCVEERLGTDPDSADAERQHVWGVRYIDDLVVRDRDTDANGTLDERLYACQDGNWNTTAVVATDGTVQERYEYDPYGKLSVLAPDFSPRGASSFDRNIAYAGYRVDAATGLYQVRFRFLHPRLGWIARDPLEYQDGPNLYQYVVSNPLRHVDPTGTSWWEWVLVLTPWAPEVPAVLPAVPAAVAPAIPGAAAGLVPAVPSTCAVTGTALGVAGTGSAAGGTTALGTAVGTGPIVLGVGVGFGVGYGLTYVTDPTIGKYIYQPIIDWWFYDPGLAKPAPGKPDTGGSGPGGGKAPPKLPSCCLRFQQKGKFHCSEPHAEYWSYCVYECGPFFPVAIPWPAKWLCPADVDGVVPNTFRPQQPYIYGPGTQEPFPIMCPFDKPPMPYPIAKKCPGS